MKKLKLQRGFTLIEMLVAMSIFMVFTGILMSSYTNIIKTQREADDYRIMYSEARKVFDGIIGELREGVVEYGCAENPYSNNDGELKLIYKDGKTTSKISLEIEKKDDEEFGTVKIERKKDVDLENFALNSPEVNVKELKFYPYPYYDPYNPANVTKNSVQFQPKVTVFALFEKERRNGEMFQVKLQTTVSSRIYNSINTCPVPPIL